MPFAMDAERLRGDIWEGAVVSALVLSLTLVLELTSIGTVRALCRQQGGKALYLSGLVMNVVNQGISALSYGIFKPALCSPNDWDTISRVRGVVLFLSTHAVLYWGAHKAMHSRSLYWMHRFHHRFNKHVPPSAANAASVYEFVISYCGPYVICALLFGTDRVTVQVAIVLISLLSALEHTPWLQGISKAVMPWFLVSTHDHMEHHRLLTSNYASPTWNVDNIIAWMQGDRVIPTRRCSSTPRGARENAKCRF
eukprot:TRINITY_DN1477_c1_g5_i1.p1 TRINITY_DN1477_c1_g5~~TRINITY_DN1477_c1_g5_i1.p1  ORF type:complete len:253 (+),score=38.75 TRINITY_DN1477_c1_g5_i1:41-799(+)